MWCIILGDETGIFYVIEGHGIEEWMEVLTGSKHLIDKAASALTNIKMDFAEIYITKSVYVELNVLYQT
jgi:hypothetical protein